MLILQLLHDPAYVVTLLATLVVSLTVHEYSHAWSALRLGDTLAYSMGRLTLDPRRHLDTMGSLFFLIAGFGWAKPVPIDAHRLGRRGTLWVALAGPTSNLVMATLALIPFRLGVPVTSLAGGMLGLFALLNVSLAVFNLLPIAPLDGWNVLMGLVPERRAWELERYRPYGMVLLLVLLLSGAILHVSILWPIIESVANVVFTLVAGHSLSQFLGGGL